MTNPVAPRAAAGQGLAIDTHALATLKAQAASDPKAAAREAAKQFESLFMNELMKSMRSSTLASGMLDSTGGQVSTEMLDTQFATQLSGRPGGLSEAILKQLERQMGLTPGPVPATGSANNTPAPLAARPEAVRVPQTGAAGFVQQHGDAARAAEAATGIPATFMVAQAAHETGWGRKEIRHADGSPSYNLFGIKAGANWKGPVAEVSTTEYINGRPQKVVAKFRAYGSYAESFADYARLMKDSPRYQAVVQGVSQASADKGTARAGGSASQAAVFAQGLQRAGYATDPAYADKLTRVINTTLRLQRSLA
ncbi:Flagellar protein flgJ (peptidoglycan hydrolase) [Rubrivivax sp. A210]|uniref:flagellar assembly peptidoglycan hydrolase FlgJ n=1 Tax=Rubrivivax sp. A210 TaxID=2772301 RepID=UPI001919A732|nr:flagellar assembly peptidoglycan hydrolase FlgJ [Rubrivivax sp. A210]CAD5374741.1 Flagellar protein flgJ (peptidoglycan hydrolase) [Rubrivivax sp. A210]